MKYYEDTNIILLLDLLRKDSLNYKAIKAQVINKEFLVEGIHTRSVTSGKIRTNDELKVDNQ